jgi:translation elongation factor EF-Tu-like GTPase
MGWFRRRDPEPVDAQAVIDAHHGQAEVPAGVSGSFRMPVEDVFSIKGRGTVVTGKVAAGRIAVGGAVAILRDGRQIAVTTIRGVEMFRKTVDSAGVGDYVGLLLDGVEKDQVARGDELAG